MSLPLLGHENPTVSSSQVEFVCSINKAFEQAPARDILVRRNVQTSWVLVWSFVVLPLLAFALYHSPLRGLIILCIFFGIFATEFFLYLRIVGQGFKPFPTNLLVDETGVTLLWRDLKRRSAEIPWTAIKSMSVSTDHLCFSVSTNQALCPPLYLLFDTSGLWSAVWPFASFKEGFILRLNLCFPLSSLTLDSDRLRLLSEFRAHLPVSIIADSVNEALTPQVAFSYTRLWLDDLHSSSRINMDDLQPEATLQNGKYEIVCLIGRGAQAKIYRILDHENGVQYALKEVILPLHGGLEARERAVASAEKEATLLSRLNHEGIVKILDHFVEDHRVYLVLEDIAGQTLRELVQSNGPLSDDDTKSITRQACDILNYLHEASPPVLHRDISPDNFMITSDGQIKLIDFSVAQDADFKSSRTVVGKNNYIAPEQFKGRATAQSDIYSLGATLFFVLTGDDPVPISVSLPSKKLERSCALDDIVSKLTAIETAQRYPDARSVLADL
jgi:tRNA A-37 threonylcarbamoyl transferase component Bud32